MKILTGLVFLFFSFQVLSQDFQAKYLTGKDLFREGRYQLAMETFRPLTNPNNSNPFTEYASFYYALSAYKDGQTYVGRDMFLQIVNRFNNWRNVDEAYLWLGQIYFEQENYALAINYLDKTMSHQVVERSRELKRFQLNQIESVEALTELQEEFPEDPFIAEALVLRMEETPLADKNIGLMEQLVNQFDLDKNKFNVVDYSNNPQKEEYNFSVVLPFMFESYQNTRRILRNSLVMSLYEGMLIAQEDLEADQKTVNLFPYDSRRDEDNTLDIINREELRSTDLIIGPLYPGPSKIINQFSYDNKINMINPLSANSEVIGNNPFSFLFKPSTETQAMAAAEFSKNKFDNKTAVILYEDTPRDSLFAYIYKQEIEKDSFNIIWFKKLTEESAREAIDTLTALYESDIPEDILDSLLEIEDYPMKLKRKEDPDDPDEYYEELLVISPDSIGHILTASSKLVLAANSLSAVNVRGDSIPLIGREEWLNYPSIGFDQLEQLGTYLIAPSFYNELGINYRTLRKKITDKFKVAPNQYHVVGYELVWYLGQMLHQHGKYFQAGIRQNEISYGKILQGVRFGPNNDNQLVPFVQFQGSELIPVSQYQSSN